MAEVNPILAQPTLWPLHLLRRPWQQPAFPLTAPHLELTYLTRNAIWRAVRLLDLEGREVVVPAYHHGVEVAALLAAGARVRFARVDGALRLDLEHVEACIGPETRALYVIHYAGFPQPMAALRALARRHGLLLLEDCALSLFSRDGEEWLGSSGDAAFFCFYKTVPVSHGGALLLQRPADAGALPPQKAPPLLPTVSLAIGSLLLTGELRLGWPGAVLRNALRAVTGSARARARREEVPVGTQVFDPGALGVGMSRLAAQVLAATDVSTVVRRRRANWRALHNHLAEVGGSPWSELPPGVCPLFYAIRVRDKDAALALLREEGVQAVDFWRWGHASVDPEAFPEVAALRRSVVELPCHQDLGPEEVERVARAALRVLRA